jgi:acetone carboxylase gamma subunit
MEIYNKIQAIEDICARRKALKELTEDDKKAYVRCQTNMRQQKYRQDNKEQANIRSRIAMKKLREENPEKYREMNIQHNRVYRAKKCEII